MFSNILTSICAESPHWLSSCQDPIGRRSHFEYFRPSSRPTLNSNLEGGSLPPLQNILLLNKRTCPVLVHSCCRFGLRVTNVTVLLICFPALSYHTSSAQTTFTHWFTTTTATTVTVAKMTITDSLVSFDSAPFHPGYPPQNHRCWCLQVDGEEMTRQDPLLTKADALREGTRVDCWCLDGLNQEILQYLFSAICYGKPWRLDYWYRSSWWHRWHPQIFFRHFSNLMESHPVFVHEGP